ncbi:MAG TPA: SUMF1/EgtB/PvdO family nonheme iron enzyme [Thermoanaerobaculia bacterium]|nr:SUMF1/EgtB/PvdO family nonheme iron enzyme [Thermoanaerobaculia bacterium]
MVRTFAFFTLFALAGCASAPPMVVAIHTVPPKFNIVPAKTLAVLGDADNAADQKREDDFIDLVITKLRRYEQYDVKDERQFSRGLNPGHGLFEAEDWQKYLQQTAGEVIVRVGVPNTGCPMTETTRDDGSDDAGDVVWVDVECRATLNLFKPRTGERIGSVNADGVGSDARQHTAWNDAMNDAADQIIGGFAPEMSADAIAIDQDAPLAHEGMVKFFSSDYAGARSLWENGLANAPNSAPLLYNLGALCEALHDPDAGRTYYLRAIAIAPQVQRYHEALAQLDRRRADAEEAAKDPAVEDAKKSVAASAQAAQRTAMAVNFSGIPYLPIDAGTFTMGCSKGDIDCDENEKPAHAVTISKPFYLAKTPATNAQYQQCVDAGACHGSADAQKALHPVVNVDWNDARAFCAWAGGRLPTEAEWEYAARGGIEGWRFPWGNSAGKGNANLADNGGRHVEALGIEPTAAAISYPFLGTTPVGTFNPNGFGLDDMTGNVSEWTADWNGYYDPGTLTDPSGPAAGEQRVVRGGSWVDTGAGARISVRYNAVPGFAQSTVGFRCAIDR